MSREIEDDLYNPHDVWKKGWTEERTAPLGSIRQNLSIGSYIPTKRMMENMVPCILVEVLVATSLSVEERKNNKTKIY
jgi:hypothetical protein